jgi:hypothetical protein
VEFVKLAKAHKIIEDLIRDEKPVHLELVSLNVKGKRLVASNSFNKQITLVQQNTTPPAKDVKEKENKVISTPPTTRAQVSVTPVTTDILKDTLSGAPLQITTQPEEVAQPTVTQQSSLPPLEDTTTDTSAAQAPEQAPITVTNDTIPETLQEPIIQQEQVAPQDPNNINDTLAASIQEDQPISTNQPLVTQEQEQYVHKDEVVEQKQTEDDNTPALSIVPLPVNLEAVANEPSQLAKEVLLQRVSESRSRSAPPLVHSWLKIKPVNREPTITPPTATPSETSSSTSSTSAIAEPSVSPIPSPTTPTRGLSLRTVSEKTRLRKQAVDQSLVMEMEGYVRYTHLNKPWENTTYKVNFASATEIIDLDKDYNYYQEVIYERGNLMINCKDLTRCLEHINLIADQQGNNGPYIISIVKSKIDNEYPIIVWSPSGEEKVMIPASHFKARPFGGEPRTKEKVQALKQRKPDLPYASLKRIDDIDFPKELYKLESSQVLSLCYYLYSS